MFMDRRNEGRNVESVTRAKKTGMKARGEAEIRWKRAE